MGLHSGVWDHADSSVGKESTCNAEDPGLIPGSGRSSGGHIKTLTVGLEPSSSDSAALGKGPGTIHPPAVPDWAADHSWEASERSVRKSKRIYSCILGTGVVYVATSL